MEPIGREVGARGRAVEGLALDVKGLAGGVVVTWVVVRGPEVSESNTGGRGERVRDYDRDSEMKEI